MLCVHPEAVTLDRGDLLLLDKALRIAYTRLIETGVLTGKLIREMRDLLIKEIVQAIISGEKDPWRLARRGLFAASLSLAQRRQAEIGSAGGPIIGS